MSETATSPLSTTPTITVRRWRRESNPLRSLILALTALVPVSTLAQTLPSPSFNNLTLSGTITGGNVTATGSTTARSLAARAADWVNAKDYGAKIDNTTDDAAALKAARAAAGVNGTIVVPNGQLLKTSNPVAGVNGVSTGLRWLLDGTSFAGGTTPVLGIASGDLVESHFGGTKYFGRTSNPANSSPGVRIDYTVDSPGGSFGFVTPALRIAGSVGAVATSSFLWGASVTVDTSATSSNGQATAVLGFANRVANTAGIFGANFVATDKTGNKPSVSGGAVGAEIGVVADDDDDGGAASTYITDSFQGTRVLLDLVATRYGASGAPATAVIGWGARVGAGGSGSSPVMFQRGFSVNGLIGKAGFTTEYSVLQPGANAFRMAAGQTFAFDKPGLHTLSYSGGTAALQYSTDGGTTIKHTWFDNGNYIAAGAITGTTFRTSQGYTVATLPACNAGAEGTRARVTDAAAPTYNTTVTGGGTVRIPVFCNGSAWVSL